MKKHLIITNQGEAEEGAFTLLGASSKRGDKSKIGLFGSGNKYALSFLLRNDYPVRIFSGEKEIKIATIKKQFRDRSYNVITVNGSETSITTDTGPDWDLWQAIREIYSNAIDEGDESVYFADNYALQKDKTTFVIDDNGSGKLKEFYDNMSRYFLIEQPFAFKCPTGEIYLDNDGDTTFYRKGIRVVEEGSDKFLFNYNVKDIEINESRIVKYGYHINRKIYDMLFRCDIPSIITYYLNNSHKKEYEEYQGFSRPVFEDFPEASPEWEKCLEGKFICPVDLGGWVDESIKMKTYFLPTTVYDHLFKQYGEKYSALRNASTSGVRFKKHEPDKMGKFVLQEVLDHLAEVGFEVNHEVEVVEFKDNDVHGLARDSKIYVSQKAIEKGKHYLARVVMEEQMHLESGCSDETREFQNHIIEKFLNYMNRFNAKPL